MVETRGLRSAFAVAQLLSSLAVGGVEDRLNALRSLRLEVIDAAQGPLPKNTARVLLQIMKELVRAFGDRRRQLELAHEFRTTFSGKPRIVRRQLRQLPPAGDAGRVEPDRLRRPRSRRQHQGPQVVHPPAHGRLDQGHPPAAHHPLQLHRAALRRRAVRRRAHPGHRRAHRHRVLGPLPGHVRAAHLGAARVRGRPVLPVLPGGAAGHAADGGGAQRLALPAGVRDRAPAQVQRGPPGGAQRAAGHRARAGRPGRVPRLRRHRPEIQAAPVQVHLRQGAESPPGAHLRFRAGAGNGRGGPAPRSLGVARAHERHGPRGADRRLSRAAAQPRDRLPRPPGRFAGRPRAAAPLAPGDARPPDRAARRLPGDPEPHEPEGRGGPGAALRLPGDDHAAGDLQPEGLLRRQDGPRGRDRHPDAGDQRGQRHPPEAGHPRDHRTRAGDRAARADREAQGHPLRHRRPQVLLRGPAAQVAHRQRLDGPLRAFSRHGARHPGDPAAARAARDRARPQGRGPRDHPGADDGAEDAHADSGGGRFGAAPPPRLRAARPSCSTRTG